MSIYQIPYEIPDAQRTISAYAPSGYSKLLPPVNAAQTTAHSGSGLCVRCWMADAAKSAKLIAQKAVCFFFCSDVHH
jgi:hypothetical protein